METICIPWERYEYLIKCERLVDMEFEEKFSDEFIAEVKESEEAYARGEYIEVNDREEREKLFLNLPQRTLSSQRKLDAGLGVSCQILE